MLLAYIDPMTTIPLTSVVVTVVGFVLLLGRVTLRLPMAVARRVGHGLGRLRVAVGGRGVVGREDEGA